MFVVLLFVETQTEQERETEKREGDRWQAVSFKEFVRRQSLSLIMRKAPHPTLVTLSPLSSPPPESVKGNPVPHGACLQQLRYTKGEKRTPKSQKRRAEWHVKICKCKWISKVN